MARLRWKSQWRHEVTILMTTDVIIKSDGPYGAFVYQQPYFHRLEQQRFLFVQSKSEFELLQAFLALLLMSNDTGKCYFLEVQMMDLTDGLESFITHLDFLRAALDEACKCDPVPTAFCVGCVITTHWPTLDSPPVILTRGYSRELPGNTHAEANALAKVKNLSEEDWKILVGSAEAKPSQEELLRNADVYTTMVIGIFSLRLVCLLHFSPQEPCSIRTSGLAPCADALIAAKVRRCFIGVNEPPDFVNCEGTQKLKDAGIEVVWIKDLEKECLDVARRI